MNAIIIRVRKTKMPLRLLTLPQSDIPKNITCKELHMMLANLLQIVEPFNITIEVVYHQPEKVNHVTYKADIRCDSNWTLAKLFDCPPPSTLVCEIKSINVIL